MSDITVRFEDQLEASHADYDFHTGRLSRAGITPGFQAWVKESHTKDQLAELIGYLVATRSYHAEAAMMSRRRAAWLEAQHHRGRFGRVVDGLVRVLDKATDLSKQRQRESIERHHARLSAEHQAARFGRPDA